MDPPSATAGISTICVRAAKSLVGFYDDMEETRDVLQYVAQLTSELAAPVEG